MTSPTFASLPGVSPAVVDALAARGIIKPFAIQEQVVPLAIAGGDVLAQAPTGSGKTIAFGLPLVHFASGREGKTKGPDSLVLVPTRELAVQVSASPGRNRVAAHLGQRWPEADDWGRQSGCSHASHRATRQPPGCAIWQRHSTDRPHHEPTARE